MADSIAQVVKDLRYVADHLSTHSTEVRVIADRLQAFAKAPVAVPVSEVSK